MATTWRTNLWVLLLAACAAIAGCSGSSAGSDAGPLDSGLGASDASDGGAVDAAEAPMCTEPAGGHCCCTGDVVHEPVCGADERWTCERGTYHTGDVCRWDGTTCGTPCTLPCPPDAGM